jgi:hypothetical protein
VSVLCVPTSLDRHAADSIDVHGTRVGVQHLLAGWTRWAWVLHREGITCNVDAHVGQEPLSAVRTLLGSHIITEVQRSAQAARQGCLTEEGSTSWTTAATCTRRSQGDHSRQQNAASPDAAPASIPNPLAIARWGS